MRGRLARLTRTCFGVLGGPWGVQCLFLFLSYLSLLFFSSGLIVLSHIIIADFNFALYLSNPHNAKVLSQKAAVIAMIFMVPLMAIINLRQLNNKKISLRVFG